MSQRIKSIVEAYSMQPNVFYVPEAGVICKNPDQDIKHIEREQVDQYEWDYVGYNFNEKMLFRYHEKSVNVHYYTD